MDISGSVALVTGANRGIGAEFVRQLQARGAARVYATARRPELIRAEGVERLALDVTDPSQIAAAAAAAPDVTLLVNNAGSLVTEPMVSADPAPIRAQFETNVFGPLALANAFAPILAANGGGAILNVNSALSWFSYPGSTIYSASKAASWSITDGLRVELAEQGTQVLGLHMGAVDTDMMAGYEGPKVTPEALVAAALDGLAAGASEVLADDTARQQKASLGLDPAQRYGALVSARS